MRSRLWLLVGGLATAVIAAVGVAALVWWRLAPAPPVPAVVDQGAVDRADDAEDPELEKPAVQPPGYLGPQACVPCHARRVAEFQKTSHFRTCRVPGADTMPKAFATGKNSFSVRHPPLRFEMARQGEDFIQTAIRATPTGEQRTPARIALVIGAGGTDEVYLTWHDDRLYELPIVWLHPQDRWGANPFDRRGWGDFSRQMTPRCLECHNTWFEHVPGTPNQYHRRGCILGVTCERCHGPGRDHVVYHQAHPEDRRGHAIVHPGRLSRARQLDVCGQCHANAIRYRRSPFSYRPGAPLEDYYKILASKHPEDDHVANQVKYLRQSQCFQKSSTLTCVTCHNPHRPQGPSNAGSASCLKCHSPAACGDHDRMPAAVRGNCVGCHMPTRSKIQVSFDTQQDLYVSPVRSYQHRIGIYPMARLDVLLTWHVTQKSEESRREAARLRQALVRHWLAEADRCRGEYRFLAAIAALREAVRLDPAPATRAKLHDVLTVQAKIDTDMVDALHQIDENRYAEAVDTLQGILRLKPDLAVAHGKLGTLYAITRQPALAVEHLEAVARYDPDNAYGYSMLGWLAYLDGRPEEALEAYRRAEEMEPFDAKIKYHRGLALVKLGRLPEAVACFRQVLTIDPTHAAACDGLGRALRQQGEIQEALYFARRAARLTRFQDAEVLVLLAELYAAAGRWADADRTATRALDAARQNNPQLEGQIRWHLESLRARARPARK